MYCARRSKRLVLLIAVPATVLLLLSVLAATSLPTWLLARLPSDFHAQTGHRLKLSAIDIDLLGTGLAIKLIGVELRDPAGLLMALDANAELRLAWSSLFKGHAVAKRVLLSGGELQLTAGAGGRSNWHALADALTRVTASGSADRRAEPPFERLIVDGLVGNIYLSQPPVRSRLVLWADVELGKRSPRGTVAVEGRLNDQSVDLRMSLRPSGADLLGRRTLRLDATVADTVLSLIGPLHLAENRLRGDIELSYTGNTLAGIGQLIDRPWLRSEPFELDAHISFDEQHMAVVLHEAKAGHNQVEARIDVRRRDGQTSLAVALAAPRLRLDEFVDVDVLSAATARRTRSSVVPDPAAREAPVPAPEWFEQLAARYRWEIDVHVGDARWRSFQLYDLDFSSNLSQEVLKAKIHSDDFAGGRILAEASLRARDTGEQATGAHGGKPARAVSNEGSVELDFHDVDLAGVLAAIDVDDALAGSLSGQARYWFEGGTPHDMLSSLDGGLFLLLTAGRLDALYVELAGLDIMESAVTFFRRHLRNTPIRCAFLDLHSQDGLTRIGDFVIDTEDTIFTGKGYVDFRRSLVDMRFEPHPRDFSFLAAPTSLHIRGELSSPRIRPGRKLYTRLAAAAALATVATPAAALIAFMDMGSAVDSAQCAALVDGLQ